MDLVLHLRGFIAVADELSVSEAAAELGIDQPLLSRRLRALERHLGVELLDRSRRRIALTAAGSALLPRARQLVEQSDHLVRSARATNRGAITVAVPPEPDPVSLARVLTLLDAEGVSTRLTTIGDDGDPGYSAAWVMEFCDPGSATWTTPLGAATATSESDRPIRLSHLRPRRGATEPPVLVLPHDLVPPRGDHLRKVADRSGLSPGMLQECPYPLAVAEVLAGRATMICSEPEARRHDLAWAPFVDPPLVRAHRLVEHPPLPECLVDGAVRHRALRLLGAIAGEGR